MVVVKCGVFKLTPRKGSRKARLVVTFWVPHVAVTLGHNSTSQSKQTASPFSVFYVYFPLAIPSMIRGFLGSQGKNLIADV